MTLHKITFEKHNGLLDVSNGSVMFYMMVFQSILHVREFLGAIEPGNYKGWVHDGRYGLLDIDSGWIYVDLEWHPPNSIRLNI